MKKSRNRQKNANKRKELKNPDRLLVSPIFTMGRRAAQLGLFLDGFQSSLQQVPSFLMGPVLKRLNIPERDHYRHTRQESNRGKTAWRDGFATEQHHECRCQNDPAQPPPAHNSIQTHFRKLTWKENSAIFTIGAVRLHRLWWPDGSCLQPQIQPGLRPMQITKQLAVFLDNRPGMLARVADALAHAKINIYAITTSDTVDHSVIRMVVNDYRKAMLVFEEHGTLVVEDEVLMIDGTNKPGELARMAHKLADAKINIEYCYSATPVDAKKGLMIMRVSNPGKALKVLNS
jgi:hypothetical protein